MLKRLLCLICCLVLVACGRQPDTDMLRTDLETRLATTYGADVFKVVEILRRGSATETPDEAGHPGKVVYFDIVLEFAKDFELDAWDRPGVASLVTLLGAGPRGVKGVKSGGTQAGDQLVVHASATYHQAAGQWVMTTSPGVSNAQAPSLDTGAPMSASRRLLATLSEISHTATQSGMGGGERIIQQELERSVARINGRLSRMQQGLPLAGGPDRGEYVALARALGGLDPKGHARITPLITQGSVDNIELLRSGNAVLALAQADTALMAYEGSGLFVQQGAFTRLRALGSLYPEMVQVVVPDDAAYRGLSDLKMKKVVLGAPGSAVHETLERVFSAHGLEAGIDYTPVDLPFTVALQALGAGRVDAVAYVTGTPALPLRDAFAHARLKLLPLDPQAIQLITKALPAMMPLEIAAGVYPGQRQSIPTVGVSALLLTTLDFTRDEAIELVRRIFQKGADVLALGSTQGAQISAENARRGVTIPLHEGADQALASLRRLP